jgi:hypothetical protein
VPPTVNQFLGRQPPDIQARKVGTGPVLVSDLVLAQYDQELTRGGDEEIFSLATASGQGGDARCF